MLLIDNKQVPIDEFIKTVERITGKEVPLKDIRNNPQFNYNPAKKAINMGIFRDQRQRIAKLPKSDDVLASFNVFDENEGRTFTMRFASRTPYTNPNNPNALVHDPKAIEFPGGVFDFEARDIEKVIYLYCHPHCYDSPFYKGGVYKYSHNNLRSASRKKVEAQEQMQKAFQHAMHVDESELKVLAKGLALSLIPNAEAEDIRGELVEYAMKNPTEYLEKVGNETTKFDGMVIQALETGFIIRKKSGNATIFEFGKGRKKGDQITIVMDSSGDATTQLKNHMKNNIAEYYAELTMFNNDHGADVKAEKFLRDAKNGADKADFIPYKEEMSLDEVIDFKSAKKFLEESPNAQGKASPANTKQFLEDVQSGNILSENVNDRLSNYIKQQ